MIIDLIQESQHGNQDATMKLIKTFSPTLRKYARALEIEDAYQDLQLDFIEVIQSIRCDELNIRGDGAMVNYLSLHPSRLRPACQKHHCNKKSFRPLGRDT